MGAIKGPTAGTLTSLGVLPGGGGSRKVDAPARSRCVEHAPL